MLRALTAVGLVGVGLGLGVPAEAAKIVFSGQGSVDASQGALVRNAAASIGSPFRFTVAFDTAALNFLEGDDQDAFYELPVTDFSATIGDYAFALSAAPGFEPLLAISRGFTFFENRSANRSKLRRSTSLARAVQDRRSKRRSRQGQALSGH